MKKRGIFIILFLLLSTSTYALTTELIYDDFIENGDSIKEAGKRFEVVFIEQSQETLISYEDNKAVTLDNGTCKRTPDYTFCVKNFKYYVDGYEVPIDILDVEDIEIDLNISAIVADLELTKEIEKTDVLVGEKIHIRTTISNTGDKTATEIEFEDKYPSSVLVRNVEGCTLDGKDIYWTGKIYKSQSHMCEYDIIITDEDSFSSQAELEYYNNFDDKGIKSENAAFEASYPDITLESKIKPRSLIIGEDSWLNFSVRNGYTQKMPIANIKVHVPKGVTILDKDVGLQQQGSYYIWKGSIEGLNTKFFYMHFRAEHSGEHMFNITEELTVNDIEFLFEESEKIEVESEYDILLDFPDMPVGVKQGETAGFNLDLRNPTQLEIKNIEVDIDTNLENFETHYEADSLGRNVKNELIRHTFNPTEDTYFNVTGTYESIYGEEFPFHGYKEIKVYESDEEIPTTTSTTTIETSSTTTTIPASEKAFNKNWIILGVVGVIVITTVLILVFKKRSY